MTKRHDIVELGLKKYRNTTRIISTQTIQEPNRKNWAKPFLWSLPDEIQSVRQSVDSKRILISLFSRRLHSF